MPRRYAPGHHLRGRKGARANAWHGGRGHRRGYVFVYVPNHPQADSYGYVSEHRLIAEQSIGRLIARNEHVHHINGIKDDNRPENLQVLPRGEHNRMHSMQALERYAASGDRTEARRRAGRMGAAKRWGKTDS